jgi:uncharacterized repeat protein (TIGR01451 family)
MRLHRQGPTKRRTRDACLLVLAAVVVLAWASIGAAAPSGSADLKISKADSPDPVGVNAPLTYTIQVENLGPDAATGVTVTDEVPKGTDFASVTASVGQCVRKGKKVTCELGGMPAPSINYGGPATVTLTVVPRKIGTVANTASVKRDQKDPVGANNKAKAITAVVGPPPTCRGLVATAVGTPSGDTIFGTEGPDVISTLGGDDTIVSLGGRDTICAGKGNDFVGAGPAADGVYGGAGADRLLGRGGPDLLRGSGGDDRLKGNRGPDRLRGGAGTDRCHGGRGADSVRGCELGR